MRIKESMERRTGRLDRIVHGLTALSILLLVMSFFPGEAVAELHRVGPIDSAPPVGNYPAWYQDDTGITLEFCDPKNDAELDGGWCLITRDVPGTPGVLSVPETFPTNYVDEHFYYSAGAEFPASPLKKILWEAAVEAAFAVDVQPGGQIVFSRIRIRLEDVPVTGTYRFLHPYGEEVLEGVAGDRIFFTDDVGINCGPGDFSCAMTSRLGPFLLPSDTPGGAELPPVTEGPVPGKSYIADPARIGPVTGSLVRNFVRIEGPAGSNLDGEGNDFIETSNFTLMGRLFSGTIPSEVTVDRALYARNADGQKLEVYATGFETAQARIPGEAQPEGILPELSFFDAPCSSEEDAEGNPIPPYGAPLDATETLMIRDGNSYWAENNGITTIPGSVCVKDSAPASPVYIPRTVADEVIVTEAFFDPNDETLSVRAISSDQTNPPVLTLGGGFGELEDGAILADVSAPPAHVHVQSSAGGSGTLPVTTNYSPITAPAIGVTLMAVPGSPQLAGTRVSFIAIGQGLAAYEYQFSDDLTGSMTVTQPYSELSAKFWDTTGVPAGNYTVQVEVRRVGSEGTAEATASLPFEITSPAPATGVLITPDKPSPQEEGTAVQFFANGVGSSGYQYRFLLFDGTAWTTMQDYGVGSSWTLPDTTPSGSYTIAVDVRTSSAVDRDAVAYLAFQIGTTPPAAPATGVNISPSLPSPQLPGTEVVFTASGIGSTGYQYRFLLYNGTSWTTVQDYGVGDTWTLPDTTPAGDYTIAVDVRTSTSVDRDAVAYLTYRLSAIAPATGVIITPDLESPQPAGTGVVFTAAGIGALEYQYRFWLYDGVAWTLMQDYGLGDTWTMPVDMPAGDYTIAVDVRSSPDVYRDAVSYLPYTLEVAIE
jgi:hypothetical protein